MADFGLTKESVKGLGPGAYLVNVFPSAVLVLGLLALFTSRLYPWEQSAVDNNGKPIPEGGPSILAALQGVGIAGGLLLALTVLLAAVVLRPFQISAVQLLEGYWQRRPLAGGLQALAVERHIRRRSLHRLRVLAGEPTESSLPVAHFDLVAKQARRAELSRRRADSGEQVLAQYPTFVDAFMPTLLGNVLRRAETTAGERYGLTTVVCYPRLYPYLSGKLNQEIETQFNVIDTACTLAIVNGVLALASAPLILRWDGWSVVPLTLLVAAAVSYRGARIAAGRHGETLAAAFDLHRFDLLRALHRRMPDDALDEFSDNVDLSRVLGGERPRDVAGVRWRYRHEAGVAGEAQSVAALLPERSAEDEGAHGDEADHSSSGPDAPADDADATDEQDGATPKNEM